MKMSQSGGGYWQRFTRARISRRRAIAGAAGAGVGVAALGLVGCGGGKSSSSNNNASSAPADKSGLLTKPVNTTKTAQPGGVYSAYTVGDITHFDSLAATDFQSAVWSAGVYSRLLKCLPGTADKPADGSIEGDAAASWEVTPDAQQVTFKLRQGMLFDQRPPTNGRPLNAQDVLFSWNKFATKSNTRGDMANAISKNAPVASVTAPDNQTVVVKLAFPFAPILGYLAFIRYLLINPVESDGGYDPKMDMRGSGAWMLKSYQPSVGLEYQRNPNWYNKPYPLLDGSTYPIVPEYANALAQFRAGAVDTAAVRQEDILQTKKDLPQLNMIQAQSYSRANGTFMYFGYKPGSPFMDDRVRRAASMLIDRDLFIDTFNNISGFRQAGLDVPLRWHSHISSGEIKYWLDPQGKDLGDGAANFHYNPSDAKKLLAAAGHTSAIEAPFTYFNSIYGPTWPRTMDVVKGMLEANNDFKFTYNIVDYQNVWLPQYLYGKGLFDGICCDLTTVFPDIDGHLVAHYHSDGQYYRMPPGLAGTQQLVDMVANQRKETDADKRTGIIKDIQKYLAGNMLDVQVNGQALTFSLAWPWLGNFGVYSAWNAGGGSDGSAQETGIFTWIDKSKKSS